MRSRVASIVTSLYNHSNLNFTSKMFDLVSSALSPLKGNWPERRTYKRTPKLQISDWGKAWASSKISGAKKEKIGSCVNKLLGDRKKLLKMFVNRTIFRRNWNCNQCYQPSIVSKSQNQFWSHLPKVANQRTICFFTFWTKMKLATLKIINRCRLECINHYLNPF